MSEGAVWLRLLASLGALVLGAAAVAIVAVLAHRTPGPASASTASAAPSAPAATTTTKATPAEPAFPAPPAGAVVFGRSAGQDVVALGIVPGRRLGLQASVLDGQGKGAVGLQVSFRVGSHVLGGTACGPGCYRATAPAGKPPAEIQLRLAGRNALTWNVTLPKRWPPPDGSSIMARATRAFRSLKTLTTDDSLSSGLGKTLYTHWTIAAPNRLSYQVRNGPAAVIIGDTRWDKTSAGEPWVKSAQTPIHQPTQFWVTWKDAHVVAETRKTWRVTFFDPKTPGWYDVTVAKRSLLTLQMGMNAAAHFMHQRYGNFNEPVKIVPPR